MRKGQESGHGTAPWVSALSWQDVSTHNFVPDSSDCHLPSQCLSSESRVMWRDIPWSLTLSCLFAPLT